MPAFNRLVHCLLLIVAGKVIIVVAHANKVLHLLHIISDYLDIIVYFKWLSSIFTL